MKKTVLIILLLAVVCAALAACVAKTGDQSSIVVLYTNDIHCAVQADDDTLGFPEVALYKQAIESVTPYVSMVDCGDAVQGRNIGTFSSGEYIVELMNKIGYDVCIPGNHEFDYGMAQFNKLVEMASAKYVSSNFTDLLTNKTVLEPYTIISYGNIDIAYVGICTPYTMTSSNPKSFKDENGEFIFGFQQSEDGKLLYDSVQASVDAAINEGADYVIALSHLGYTEEGDGFYPYSCTDVIANTYGIDILLDGHSHTVIEGIKCENKYGERIPVSSTGTGLQYLGQLTIKTNGTESKSDDVITTELISNSVCKEIADSIGEMEASYEEKLKEVVAFSEAELSIYSASGTRLSRNREIGLGNFCADAYRAVSGSDIAFMNGGGVRTSIPAGDVTYGHLLSLHPFGNVLCVVEATGADILDALEHSYRFVLAEAEKDGMAIGETGGFLHLSGMKVVIDTSIESTVYADENGTFAGVSGERRVVDVQVLDSATGLYLPIELEKVYTVASISYLLKDGGDGFGMFIGNKIIVDDFSIDVQALIDYVNILGGTIGSNYASPEGRITIK